MERYRERETERDRQRETERERHKGDFDSSNSPGQDLSTKQVPVFQEDIQHMGKKKNSTLVAGSSLLLGLTLEMCPLQSQLPNGR